MSQDVLEEDSNDSTNTNFAKEAFKKIAPGSVAGMVAEIFRYPFDLTKVRLQAQLLHSTDEGLGLRFHGPLDCLKKTWKEEGLRGLYRGVSVPMMGSMAQTASVFFAYSSFQDIIQGYYYGLDNHRESSKHPLTIPQFGVAAAGAGFTTSFILTPIELVKCRIQVQMMKIHSQVRVLRHESHDPRRSLASLPTSKFFSFPTRLGTPALQPITPSSSVHSITTGSLPSSHPTTLNRSLTLHSPGALSIIRSIFRDHGLKGFWLGQTGTMFRETGGCATWFMMKEIVADALQKRRLNLRSEAAGAAGTVWVRPSASSGAKLNLLPWESAMAGSTAGATAILLIYPADTVKSAIQTEAELRSQSAQVRRSTASSTFWRTAFKVYRTHGLKGFYAGCGMTVARSVPSSGIVFVVYDGLRQWFST